MCDSVRSFPPLPVAPFCLTNGHILSSTGPVFHTKNAVDTRGTGRAAQFLMQTNTSQATSDDITKLATIIKKVNIGMLTTAAHDGAMHARPMSTQNEPFDGHELWFFTSAPSGKTAEIQNDQNVNVSYANPGDNAWVSISGKATIVRDRAKIDQYWNAGVKPWFPQGKEDPSLALIRVDVDSAEYWDSASSTLVQVVGYIKATLTGKAADGGENRRVDLHR